MQYPQFSNSKSNSNNFFKNKYPTNNFYFKLKKLRHHPVVRFCKKTASAKIFRLKLVKAHRRGWTYTNRLWNEHKESKLVAGFTISRKRIQKETVLRTIQIIRNIKSITFPRVKWCPSKSCWYKTKNHTFNIRSPAFVFCRKISHLIFTRNVLHWEKVHT